MQNDSLLKEYELCQEAVQALEDPIWQASSIAGLGSIGSLALLAQAKPDLAILVTGGFALVLLTFFWWWIVRRWWSIQHTKLERMFEIEAKVESLRQVSYVRYLDKFHRRGLLFLPRRRSISYRRNLVQFRKRIDLPPSVAKRLRAVPFQRRGPLEILAWLRWTALAFWIVLVLNSAGA